MAKTSDIATPMVNTNATIVHHVLTPRTATNHGSLGRTTASSQQQTASSQQQTASSQQQACCTGRSSWLPAEDTPFDADDMLVGKSNIKHQSNSQQKTEAQSSTSSGEAREGSVEGASGRRGRGGGVSKISQLGGAAPAAAQQQSTASRAYREAERKSPNRLQYAKITCIASWNFYNSQ